MAVIVLALDAAETRLLEKYAADGKLPFLSQFLRNWRIVQGPYHFCEMGAWPTLWSGVPATQHGFYCIRRLVSGTYELQPTGEPVYPCPPFWTQIDGLSVSVWDAQSVRPDANLRGEQLCNWRTSFTQLAPQVPESSPVHLAAEVIAKYGPAGRPVNVELHDTPEQRESNFRVTQERIATAGRMFRDALDRDHDLYVFGTAELHGAAHICWTYDADGERRLLEHYQAVDREMAQVAAKAPAGSRILVVAAYGIESNYPVADAMQSALTRLGYQVPSKHWSPKQLLPISVRRQIGALLPLKAQESLIRAQVAGDTDWSRTLAFALPVLYSSNIRINLKGREPQGIVEPGAEYHQVVDRIISDIHQFESPRPARIDRMADLCGGQPPELVPDIVVAWEEREKPWDEVVHPRFREPIPRHAFHRSSFHSNRGFLGALDSDVLDGIPASIDITEVAGHMQRIVRQAGRGTPEPLTASN